MNAAYSPTYPRPLTPLFIFLLAGIALMVLVTTLSHAETRHPTDVESVRKCMQDNNFLQFIVWTSDFRYTRFCVSQSGKVGIRPFKQIGNSKTDTVWSEITAYWSDEINGVPGLMKWVTERGWELLQIP